LFRSHRFQGGLVLPAQHHAPLVGRIEALLTPPVLHVPLGGARAPIAEPIVEPGQVVVPDETIAVCHDTPGPEVHAPVAGKVEAIRPVTTTDGWHGCGIILATLADDPTAQPVERAARVPDDTTGYVEFCDDFGLLNGVDEQPLSTVFRNLAHQPIHDLIVTAIAREPAETAAPAALLDGGSLGLEASAHLGRALGARRTWVAVTRMFLQGRELLHRYGRANGVRPIILPDRYPQGAVPLLVKAVLGWEVPLGRTAQEVGVLVVDALTVSALRDALSYGRPRTHALVTICGDAVARRADYRVPLGTPVAALLERVGVQKPPARILSGGPLAGTALRDGEPVVGPATRCLTVLSHDAIRVYPAGPCTRCGWCVDDCPVGLDPAALMNLAEQYDFRRAAPLRPQACIDCGICSYVCPAHLDLMEGVRLLKRHLEAREGAA
jgi:electron transport complex protein RnfC